jgi:hypothetical protein
VNDLMWLLVTVNNQPETIRFVYCCCSGTKASCIMHVVV